METGSNYHTYPGDRYVVHIHVGKKEKEEPPFFMSMRMKRKKLRKIDYCLHPKTKKSKMNTNKMRKPRKKSLP